MSGSDDASLKALAGAVGSNLAARGETVSTAESCTGGWIAKVMTDIAGSSGWFGFGFVTYSNTAKHRLLDVPESLIDTHGAVSREVVAAMAEGALTASGADHAIAVSGIAGPGGGTPEKPVGLVWFAWSRRGRETAADCHIFDGGRDAVRRLTVRHALGGLLTRLEI